MKYTHIHIHAHTHAYKLTDGTGLNVEHLLLLRVSCPLRGNHQATAKTVTIKDIGKKEQ